MGCCESQRPKNAMGQLDRALAPEKSFLTRQSDEKIAEKLIKTIEMLEEELQRPVYFVDIYKATVERPIDGE